MFLLTIAKEFNNQNIKYALVGGHAVAIHGAVRGTMDVDMIIKWSLSSLKQTEKSLKHLGLVPRLPISAKDVYNFRDEYINNRNLIAWNFYNPIKPSQQVDIIITHDLAKTKSIKVKYLETNITVIAKADLIKMKQQSGRQQDLLDIEALNKV